MAETKGITIDIYGNAKEFEKTLDDVNKGLKGTKDELKTINKELKINPNNLDALNDKIKNLTNQEKLLTEQVELYKKELAKLGAEEVGGEKWKNLSDQITKAQEKLSKTTEDIQYFTNKKESIEQTGNAFKNVKNNVNDAGDGVIKLGDLIKANVISEAIINGVKALANEIKSMATELNKWADSYREAQVYEMQFENNIRNTADATDEEIKALKDLAKQKSKQGVISKRAITSGYQELATYVESTDAIEMLTDALVDMSAQQYGVDASAESVRNLATTLGKALANGDFSGLTRLGYGFTEAQKRIMKYGDELQRAEVIATIVGDSIGGMNEKLLQTDAGQLFQVNQYFDDIKTSVGEVVSELELDFIQGIMPDLQALIDNILGWIIEHKDEMVQMVSDIITWLTSEDTKEFFQEVADMVVDLGNIITDLGEILGKTGLVEGAWHLLQTVVQGVADIIHAIRNDIEYISTHGIGDWAMGNYNSYDWGSGGNGWDAGWSGGYGAMNSGGHSITLNPVFNINANNVTRADVRAWSQWMLDDINDGLGRAI